MHKVFKFFGWLMVATGIILVGDGGTEWSHQWGMGETYIPSHDTPAHNTLVQTAIAQQQSKNTPTVNWVVYKKRPAVGEKIGELIIPKLKIKLPIVEGTDEAQLEKGIGHYQTSVLPGEPDNSVIAGHRETKLRDMGQLKKGDDIIIHSDEGTFTFRVTKTWITDKEDRTVIVSLGCPVLTVITCYPFNWIGAAPQRYIVQADLVGIQNQN
jgi:sortase A